MYLEEYVVEPAEQIARVRAAKARLNHNPAPVVSVPVFEEPAPAYSPPPADVIEAIGDVTKPTVPLFDPIPMPQVVRMADIISAVAVEFGTTAAAIRSSARSRGGVNTPDLITPRHAAMYLCRRLTHHSYPEIGRRIGGRDHTTVLHGYQRMAERIKSDPVLAERIEFLASRFKTAEAGE